MVRNTSQFFSAIRDAATAPAELIDGIARSCRAVLSWLVYWDDLARQRRALSRLDDRQLMDIGVTRMEADAESHRWSAPHRSRRIGRGA